MMWDLGHALQINFLPVSLRKRDRLLFQRMFGGPLVLRKAANRLLRGQ
jgi:hypothetical protein